MFHTLPPPDMNSLHLHSAYMRSYRKNNITGRSNISKHLYKIYFQSQNISFHTENGSDLGLKSELSKS